MNIAIQFAPLLLLAFALAMDAFAAALAQGLPPPSTRGWRRARRLRSGSPGSHAG